MLIHQLSCATKALSNNTDSTHMLAEQLRHRATCLDRSEGAFTSNLRAEVQQRNYTDQSHVLESNSQSGSVENFPSFFQSKVSLNEQTGSQMNRVNNFQPVSVRNIFVSWLSLSKSLFRSVFRQQCNNATHFGLVECLLICIPSNICGRVQIMEIPILQHSSSTSYFVL